MQQKKDGMEQIEQLRALLRQHFKYGHVHVVQTEPEYQLTLYYRQPNARLKEADPLRDIIGEVLPPSRHWFSSIAAGEQPEHMPIRANDPLTRVDLLASADDLKAICTGIQHSIGGQYQMKL